MGDMLRVGAHDRSTIAVYSIEGVVDLPAAAEVMEGIGSLLQRGPSQIDVDLSRLDYIDSVGFSVFVTAHYQCLDAGVRLRFLNPNPLIARLLQNNGLDEILQNGPFDALVGSELCCRSDPRGAHGRFDSCAHRRAPLS